MDFNRKQSQRDQTISEYYIITSFNGENKAKSFKYINV